jgi:glutaredoxin
MEVKIYSISDCKYCEGLKQILDQFKIEYQEVKVLRADETGEGISYNDYLNLEPSIPLLMRCTFPQCYIDGKYTGSIQSTLRHLQNENK